MFKDMLRFFSSQVHFYRVFRLVNRKSLDSMLRYMNIKVIKTKAAV